MLESNPSTRSRLSNHVSSVSEIYAPGRARRALEKDSVRHLATLFGRYILPFVSLLPKLEDDEAHSRTKVKV